ncbi:MAG: zinc chelation protein SecC [Chlamydiia bacterium]|nr:zinc chelation protein SecC [Chlamydiia bacterium]
MPKHCPCHSNKLYKACCQPFHEGALPQTALQLMRSRYSAYALNLPDYILATTHPDSPQPTKESLIHFSTTTTFAGLTILDSTETTVTFHAHLLQQNRDASFTEKSHFEKLHGRWYYHSAASLE